MANLLTEFLFPELGARGALIEFDEGVDAMLGSRPYPATVRHLLGDAVAAMPLLASHARFAGRMALQFHGQGALQMLVAQVDGQLQVRGMAKCATDTVGDFQTLMQGGRLGLLLEQESSSHSYQALVAIEGRTLAESLEHYFEQSEQLPTLLRLSGRGARIAGLLLQRMPLGENNSSEANWEHLQALFATLGTEELGAVEGRVLLHRLFHAETLRLFAPRAVALHCRCSREGIAAMLLSLGEDELHDHLREHASVDVTCEFCGRPHVFTAADVGELLLKVRMQPASMQRH